MSEVIHRAIVVTSWDDGVIRAAWEEANALNLLVTKIGPIGCNGYTSFLVCPCGSKEGWQAQTDYQALLDRYIAYLKNTISIEWAYVIFGNDLIHTGGMPLITCW